MRYLICLMLCVLHANAVELISGNVMDNFRKTSKWHLVQEVELSESNREHFQTWNTVSGKTLVNSLKKTRRLPYLFTKEAYGDVEVSLEFMLPKGSNSGIYLMGRYEVQIFDSYGVEDPKFSDIGAIYQRFVERNQTKPGQKPYGYDGVPPLVNAAKAPGEWQRLDIRFKAPRFDAEGKKVANALFVSVHLNGVLVQENAEATGPTRSHPVKGAEAATGPISIQGDHGPVAIRSFVVKPLAE